MLTPPQHERPRERPAQQLEQGIQILETGNCDQPKARQEHRRDCISKGKGKVIDLPLVSSIESSSTNRDREQPSRRATINHNYLEHKQKRQSRSVFERISRESRQNPTDLRQHLDQSQHTLPNQPALYRESDQRPLLPQVRENVLPLNVDIHNLKIALDALAGWNDELVDGYRQSPFSEEVRAAALPAGFKLPTINTFDEKTDPQDHMDHFSDLMELHHVDDLAHCKCFAAAKNFTVPLVSLSAIRQGSEETLRSYLNRFTSKLAKVNNPPEGGV
ncbi:hypothetical protein PanWU01x14_079730 [Parasponia andersonii]|uniref:Retrotransposon gag domain-containing protein n=1 Tax=Parasponia andersonii TaxID=3476 RepID=A0A2P5DBC9_PARAD|nr:hypothetical protein PanWU01x14_079730 [Parasponia andersonii]